MTTINTTNANIRFSVGPIGIGLYQTIQSAINAAETAGGGTVLIHEGIYTENLVFTTGTVQLLGFTSNSDVSDGVSAITISGTHTPPDTGILSASNIFFDSTGDIFLSTDAGSTVISMDNCNVNISGSGYTFNLVNWTGTFNKFDVHDTSINNGVVNNTAGATCFFVNSDMGGGTANTMITTGSTTMQRVLVAPPWDAQSGTVIIADYTTFQSTVTVETGSGGAFYFCRFTPTFLSGGAALVYNSASVCEINDCIMDSTATFTIDGTGTGPLVLGAIDFVEGTAINPALTNIVSLGGFLPGSFGTAGQVFTSNGPGVIPSFQDLPAMSAASLSTQINQQASVITDLTERIKKLEKA
jgi:hypothetical protein